MNPTGTRSFADPRFLFLFIFLALGACSRIHGDCITGEAGEDAPASEDTCLTETVILEELPVVAAVRELGPLEFVPEVKGRDGGFSAFWQDRSVWVFGDTILSSQGEDTSSWRSSTCAATSDLTAFDGLGQLEDKVDGLGVPREFLPFTPEERAFNEAHRGDDCEAGSDCGARYALWPGPLVPLPDGSALVLYTKLEARPGAFNFSTLGTGIAIWDSFDQEVRRPVVDQDSPYPTLLFQGDDPDMSAGALLLDGYLYVYAVQEEWMAHPNIVGRVLLEDLQVRSAWEFFAGDGRWSRDYKDAVRVMDGSTMLTIHFNQYLAHYVAIHSAIVSGDVVMHLADAPEGPWSKPVLLFTGKDPDLKDSWNYSGLGHSELAVDRGRFEYITYYRPGDWQGELRLVEVEFD